MSVQNQQPEASNISVMDAYAKELLRSKGIAPAHAPQGWGGQLPSFGTSMVQLNAAAGSQTYAGNQLFQR